MSAIELGVPHVIAKATSEEQGAVLKKLERSSISRKRYGTPSWQKLVSDNFLDFVSCNSVEIRQIPVGKNVNRKKRTGIRYPPKI